MGLTSRGLSYTLHPDNISTKLPKSDSIKKLTIHESCGHLDSGVCHDIKNLRHLVIKNPNLKAGENTFKGCTSLKTLQIGRDKYPIEIIDGYPVIPLSNSEQVHGISVKRIRFICSTEKFCADAAGHIAWDCKKELAVTYARAKLIHCKRLEKLWTVLNATPTDRFAIDYSIQELHCREMSESIWGSDLKNITNIFEKTKCGLLILDCDNCKKLYESVYYECMKRNGLMR